MGDEAFEPLLAERWEWHGPLTLVFHLNPRARWQDGQPLTAGDVAFTFDAHTDPKVASSFAHDLRWISAVTARDSLSAVFQFRRRYPEMPYDAVYHVRILPAHLLRSLPREAWRTAPFGRAPVGSGPYRFVAWKAGETIELAGLLDSELNRMPDDGSEKAISPHVIRHTTATHLQRAGVDINTIRAWLGHVSMNTTNVYAEVDLETKAQMLAACGSFSSGKVPARRWRDDPPLMQFLRSL